MAGGDVQTCALPICPVGHVTGDAVTGVVRFEAQFLRSGKVNMNRLRCVGGPHDAAIEARLAIHEHTEDYAAASAARLKAHFGVEAGILTVEEHLHGAVGIDRKSTRL